MNYAYSELYLENARSVLAVMFDYAINCLRINSRDFYGMFAGSHAARQFEKGNPSYLVGRSGIELTHTVLDEVGCSEDIAVYKNFERTPEYWAGSSLAFYQWKKSIRFSEILAFTEMDEICLMYPKYHEMDIRHFCDRLDKLLESKLTETKLKRLRRLSGYTQQLLALKANVPLRTIQQYEQRQKNINKAQAETVFRLAKAIGCEGKDLLE